MFNGGDGDTAPPGRVCVHVVFSCGEEKKKTFHLFIHVHCCASAHLPHIVESFIETLPIFGAPVFSTSLASLPSHRKIYTSEVHNQLMEISTKIHAVFNLLHRFQLPYFSCFSFNFNNFLLHRLSSLSCPLSFLPCSLFPSRLKFTHLIPSVQQHDIIGG